MTDSILTIVAFLVTLGVGHMIGSGRMTWRQYGLWIATGTATYSTVRYGLDLGRWPAIVASNVAVVLVDIAYERRTNRVKVDRTIKLDDGRTVITFGRNVTAEQIAQFRETWARRNQS